jgi:ubiquitin-conjugating enzyme E2 Q
VQEQNRTETPATPGTYEVGFDRARREIIFFNKPTGGCPVARGQWIVIRSSSGTMEAMGEELHCRVSETNFYPTLSVDEPVVVPMTPAGMAAANGRPMTPAVANAPGPLTSTPRYAAASFSIYSQEFDDLNPSEKCQAICKLLDTLPTVDEMRKYLSQHHPTDLRNWVERMPRDATNLLRWIIASNRACIMQVEAEAGENAKGTIGHKEERLHGADGYMQFRFAMGAPDKESRFVSEVRKTTERLDLKYPTIFAWHGSPLWNWHMIIREGLHFKNTDHGRAYGHGVYHAKDAATSTGYSGMGGHGYGYNAGGWSKSMLRISTALALNEIVNAPSEFVSSQPFYVVSQLDWIQTRYLLVKCAPTDESIKPGVEVMPKQVHPQDPHQTPKGPTGGSISIPASAIKSGRLRKETQVADKDDKRRPGSWIGSASKKLKDGLGHSVATAIDVDDFDTASVDTDIEDLAIFIEPEEKLDVAMRPSKNQSKSNGKDKASSEPTTDFVPCSLDFSTLPVMPMPTYATSATTKRLMSELGSLAKIQENNSLVSLGWSIDTEKIDNVYQWIVELHSFHTFSINDKPLPLVEDMKKANATSIVLEIRFGPDFPFSPPYIRVISPRFLPFTQGGGGHIVIGGAMCMELLTNTGWSSVMSMESVLMQVRMAIASEPFARLEAKGNTAVTGKYGAAEAADGYIRACASHGWKVPPGFKEVAYSAAERFNGPY